MLIFLPAKKTCDLACVNVGAIPEALSTLGGGDVPQAGAVVQTAAGNKVSQIMEGNPPHGLSVVCVGRHTPLLLKAPQVDARVT